MWCSIYCASLCCCKHAVKHSAMAHKMHASGKAYALPVAPVEVSMCVGVGQHCTRQQKDRDGKE